MGVKRKKLFLMNEYVTRETRVKLVAGEGEREREREKRKKSQSLLFSCLRYVCM